MRRNTVFVAAVLLTCGTFFSCGGSNSSPTAPKVELIPFSDPPPPSPSPAPAPTPAPLG